MQNTSLMRLAVALGAGLSTGIQATFFTLIGRAIGPARASLVLNLVGRILAGIILLAAIGIQGREHWNIPSSALVSATASVAMGLIIISGVAFSFPCMGVQQALQLPFLGEMLVGVIVDTLGRAGRRPIPLDLGRFLGLIIMAIGELDDPEMVRVANVMADAIPGAQKVIIPEAAHLPNMEKPAEFNGIVEDFLHGARVVQPSIRGRESK